MRRFVPSLVVLACLSAVAPRLSYAALSCPDRVPAAINTVTDTASRKCQEKIASEAAKFLRTKMTVLAKCKLTQLPGVCPTSSDTDKIQMAALKATQNIAAKCGADAAQAGLQSSYKNGTDDAMISSCVLSQHNVIGELVVANATGVRTQLWPGTPVHEGGQCVKEIAKRARLFTAGALANAAACIKKQMKHGVAGDLAPICVGSFSGGAFVPPTDTLTAQKQSDLLAKVDDKLEQKCAFIESSGLLPTIFACGGASTVAELQTCLECQGWSGVFDAVEQEYSERGTLVAHAAGAIQTATDAATGGDKLLIAPGDYAEEVLIATDNLSYVGCGGATDNRPRIIPPATEVSGRGLRANGVNGLSFQSLSLFGQANDGIHVTLANGVTFRDIIGDGNLVSSYEVFPQTSNNVVVELCKATNAKDAPLYIGQSSTVLARFNEVRNSVSAIEIENCGNATVHNNYSTNNTAGLLVFKDGSLPVQLAQCHHVHHNVLENNNTHNFGAGTVALVPDGTGLLILSADSTPYHHNVVTGHKSLGIALTDQAFSGFGPPFSADPNPENNYFYSNIVTGNGFAPDTAKLPPGIAGDMLAVAFVDPATLGNCRGTGADVNIFDTEINFSSLPVCTLPPPAFAGCPAPPVP